MNSSRCRPDTVLVQLWDGRWWPALWVDGNGLIAFEFKCAPSGLATRRQLRALGRQPGRRKPDAVLIWRSRRREGEQWANLWRIKLSPLKKTPSAAQLAGIDKALAARRTCRRCGQDSGYYLPRRSGVCDRCLGIPPYEPPACWTETEAA